jgi:hypothetical protein
MKVSYKLYLSNNNRSAQIRQIQDKYLLLSKVTNSRVRWNDTEISIQSDIVLFHFLLLFPNSSLITKVLKLIFIFI